MFHRNNQECDSSQFQYKNGILLISNSPGIGIEIKFLYSNFNLQTKQILLEKFSFLYNIITSRNQESPLPKQVFIVSTTTLKQILIETKYFAVEINTSRSLIINWLKQIAKSILIKRSKRKKEHKAQIYNQTEEEKTIERELRKQIGVQIGC